MKANYHTHTYRCGHASGQDEQYVKAAIDAGLKIIGFSDHMPVPNYHNPRDRMDCEQWTEYLNSINSLKQKYAEKITILIGVEAEWIPTASDYLRQVRSQVDYMILGQHERFTATDHYDYTYYCSDEDVLEYAQNIVEGLRSGLYAYLAHPDYFMLGRNSFNESCEQAAHIIASACEELSIPVEINLKGFQYKRRIDGVLQPVYPFIRFWEILKQYKLTCIYGCDAHRPTDLFRGELIDEVMKHLGHFDFEILETLDYL
jgi:histidinol-phosphatase (PHP family)